MSKTDAPERWIVIPRWDEFQHRDMARSTIPPWIKTYTKLLHDEAYLSLTSHQRAVLHGLWLEYASARRHLLLSTTSLSARLRLRVMSRDIEALNHAGFITISASRPASNLASNLASLEVEVEKEKSKSKSRPPRGAARAPASRDDIPLATNDDIPLATNGHHAHNLATKLAAKIGTGLDI